MKTIPKKIQQMSIGGFLCCALLLFLSGPAQAFPIGGHPDKCKGGVPDGAFSCENGGGTVSCTNDGDYMCCHKNSQGGQDCEQIETMTTNPMGGVKRFQGGVLQNPTVSPSPNTSRFPKTGAKSPIMRRGIESEQTDEPAPGKSE